MMVDPFGRVLFFMFFLHVALYIAISLHVMLLAFKIFGKFDTTFEPLR